VLCVASAALNQDRSRGVVIKGSVSLRIPSAVGARNGPSGACRVCAGIRAVSGGVL